MGIVHTHPSSPGESINDFRYLAARNINELTDGVPIYNAGEVSSDDKAFVKSSDLPLYVMDAEKIRKITTSGPGKYALEYERCGY